MRIKRTNKGQLQISEMTADNYSVIKEQLRKVSMAKVILNAPNALAIVTLQELYREKFSNEYPSYNNQGLVTMTWRASDAMAFRLVPTIYLGTNPNHRDFIDMTMECLRDKLSEEIGQFNNIIMESINTLRLENGIHE
ncbi:hypothetical protein V9L05_18915 [Bernardetia sp. Wsw4-3y2]|uniref:hypothetical protein n=1 Tax=Bernardetia sp. Wsw4-3y2 TaxID=3127471 RepID=UPI0030CAF28E